MRRTSSCRSSRTSRPPIVDAAALGVEEAEEQVRDGRLPRSARPDEGDALAGLELRSTPSRTAGSARRSGRSRPRARPRPARSRPALELGGSVIAGLRSVSSSTRAPAARVAGSSRAAAGSGATASNEESASSASVATSTRSSVPVVVRGDGDREHADDRQPGDEHQSRVGEAGDEGVAPAESAELRVGGTRRGERVVLPTVRDELGSAAQDLDELGGELAARGGLPPADDRDEPRGEQRHGDSPEREAERQHDGGRGQDDGRRDDAGRADHERDERRPEPAQVEALERVDVGDQPGQEVAAPVRVELGRRERLDPLVDGRADPAERAQREVVRREPLEVARQRPGEREEADDDDGRRQREDRRLLGGARDQVAGRRSSARRRSRRRARRAPRASAMRPRGMSGEREQATRSSSRASTASRRPGRRRGGRPGRRARRARAGARRARPSARRAAARPPRRRSRRSPDRGRRSARRGSRAARRAGTRARARSAAARPPRAARPPSPTTVS